MGKSKKAQKQEPFICQLLRQLKRIDREADIFHPEKDSATGYDGTEMWLECRLKGRDQNERFMVSFYSNDKGETLKEMAIYREEANWSTASRIAKTEV